jgi:hypothetical protein
MKRSLLAVLAVAVAAPIPFAQGADKKPGTPKVCTNLSARDQEILTMLPRQNIVGVDRLLEMPAMFDPPSAGERTPVLRGVTIAVRAVEGLTRERLQVLVQCGIARTLAADPSQPTDWPRTPPDTVPYVHSGGDRFLVDLRTRDEAAAELIWNTAQQLKPK